MATVNLPTHLTLVANTVTTVVCAGDYQWLDVYNQTAGTVVYARGDGTAPTVAGDECWPVFPVPADDTDVPVRSNGDGTTTIQLISSGTPTVSILGRDADEDDC